MRNSNNLKLMTKEVIFLKFCGLIYFLYGLLMLVRERELPGLVIDGIFICGIYFLVSLIFYFGVYLWYAACTGEFSFFICCIGPLSMGLGALGELMVFKSMLNKPVNIKIIIAVCVLLIVQILFMFKKDKKEK